jgi:hypothetical protein
MAKQVLAASITLCSALAGQLLLAGLAHADAFRQPRSDVGRISQNAPGDPAGDHILVCDTATHTWFILPMMPRVAHHDAGTACTVPNDEALSQDNNYLLTCINGLWVNGT